MSGVVTFDGAPAPGTINLAIGQPSADMLPVELVREASESFFSEAQPLEFNYGVTQGDARFLESLAALLSRHYGAPASAGLRTRASDRFPQGASADCGVIR